MTRLLQGVVWLLIVVVVAGCNISGPDTRPTATDEVEVIATVVSSPAPTGTATAVEATPVATRRVVEVATVLPSDTPAPPSPAVTATSTSLYIEYFVQEGETLFYIIQLPEHGYGYEPNVAATVVALNDNISKRRWFATGSDNLDTETDLDADAGQCGGDAGTTGVDRCGQFVRGGIAGGFVGGLPRCGRQRFYGRHRRSIQYDAGDSQRLESQFELVRL